MRIEASLFRVFSNCNKKVSSNRLRIVLKLGYPVSINLGCQWLCDM